MTHRCAIVVTALCALVGACPGCGGGTPTEPTKTSAIASPGAFSPAAGSTLTAGTPFSIARTYDFADTAMTHFAFAFLRDDGAYSRGFECGSGQGGTLGGAVSGTLNSDSNGRLLYDFAKGRRVNAVLMLGATAICQGDTVVPANATLQRVEIQLNWSIQ